MELKLIRKEIEGRQIEVYTESKKFILAGKKGDVKNRLENSGAIVKKFNKEQDVYLLIGRDFFVSGNYSYINRKYLFEDELLENHLHLSFFPNLKRDFYNMIRGLLQREDLYIHYFSIGKPLSNEDFDKYEKKLKRKIPTAVKELYSAFGHIQILWDYREPYVSRRVRAGKAWNLDANDNHIGSLQILPLKTVLFEKWDAHFDVDNDLKIFDFYSEYNMIALDLDSGENPTVYKGNNYGNTFTDHSTMSFTDYVYLALNLHGLRERGGYFVYFASDNFPKVKLEDVIKKPSEIPSR
ncbi:hypothetical protein [Chryseobacterium gambrini]|uniref:hypothetical protein n=1 Tax=Chryseobacterium gambrini TaxID=373672 RepID=UPI0022F1831B|nr:hypothetical protein [Chryseobacterium gambrini]WBV53532.1 hypothetical protein PFY09_04255 [Chryseobacterium gambrini]